MGEILSLFISFFKIGLFSFGGGYAMIPLMQEEVIFSNSWISQKEFLDMIAISQVTPGPIAINAATFIGAKVSGVVGSGVATVAVVLPSFIIVMTLILLLKKMGKSKNVDIIYTGVRPVVIALIFSALVSIGRASITDVRTLAIAAVSFAIITLRRVNVFVVIILAGIAGYALY